MRHSEPAVRGYAVTHPVGEVHLPSQPDWQFVLYARSGVLTARTDRRSWTVPAHRALCVGDGTQVRVRTRQATAVRSLYLARRLDVLPPSIRVVEVTPLARELLLHAVERSPLDVDLPADGAIVTLLTDLLATLPTAALRLDLPLDPRARRLAELVVADPSRPLAAAMAETGASRRTLERLFASEVRLSPAAWRRRARIHHAVQLLEEGASVTVSASAIGYSTPSAFVAAFRAELGTTPLAHRGGREGGVPRISRRGRR